MYLASLYPDRISVRYEGNRPHFTTEWERRLEKKKAQSKINLAQRKQTFALSYQSKRKIRDTVGLLGQLSKPRTIWHQKSKPIYNFRTAFITLTLPSEQVHTDLEIKKCLNNFLTSLRSVYGLKNYIWKAELQANENIHFHIITDIFISHQAVRYYWNSAIEVLGYVSAYRCKYLGKSLQDYAEMRKTTVDKALRGFQFGQKTDWKSPPTEQVISIHSIGQLSYYVSKYVSKDFGEEQEPTAEEVQRIQNFGRTWARSQSLSKIKFVTRYNWEELKSFIRSLDSRLEGIIKVEHQYCTTFYFNFKELSAQVKSWLSRKMHELGITYQYPFPI